MEDHDQAAQGEVRDVVRLIVNQCLQGILDNDKAAEDTLAAKGKDHEEISSKMLEDEKYPRETFKELLLLKDNRTTEIFGNIGWLTSEPPILPTFFRFHFWFFWARVTDTFQAERC